MTSTSGPSRRAAAVRAKTVSRLGQLRANRMTPPSPDCSASATTSSGMTVPSKPTAMACPAPTAMGEPSAPLEHRRTLLDEGPYALPGVFRLRGDVLREGLELECRAEIDVEAVIERPLCEPDGDGRAGRDLPRQLVGGRHQLLRWMDGADDPEPERRLGVDDLAGEDQLARLGHAYDARQDVRSAQLRVDAPRRACLADRRGA